MVGGILMESIYEKRPWIKHYPEDIPMDLTIGDETTLSDFEKSVERYETEPAIYYFDHKITFGELNTLSEKMASALYDMGLREGDRIVVDLQNIPQFLVAIYGAWKLGAIVVPLNPMYKERELEYFFNDSGAKVLFALDEVLEGLNLDFLKNTGIEHVISTSPVDLYPIHQELPDMLKGKKEIKIQGARGFKELIEEYEPGKYKKADVRPDSIAYLTYTSGTTGPPKGAMNTQGNVAFTSRVYQRMLRMDNSDVVLGVAPLFHVTGEVAHTAVSALCGAPVVLFYRFDPGECLRLIEKWKCTMTVASITVFIAMLNHADIKMRNLSSFKKAYSGGAPVSEAIVEQFEEKTGVYIHNVYGMTETTSPSHLVPLGKRAPVDPDSKALSVGVPIPNSIIKIMDLEDGTKELPPGEVGEIVDSGPMIVHGYWMKEEETKKALRDGWLYTGDVGKMDEDGWFYVVDRKKDLIVASGYKVWPREVEDVIYQHPGVRETAVVGVPDPYRGETVKAFVALKDEYLGKVSEDEIIRFCKERMAAYKYPRIVEIVEEIPKTLTGKFLRRELRDREKQKKE